MTAPPLKAVSKALPCPSSLAACVVLTLALVAAFIPRKPAKAEQSAPETKANEVFQVKKKPRRTATMVTKKKRVRY